jgi:geranylgeranyl diphosphate synthase type II
VSAPAEPLGEYIGAQCRRVDEALSRFLPGPPACPPPLSEAMRYSLFAGGKRFRPVLVLAAAEEVAATPSLQEPPGQAATREDAHRLALPAACAIEMIHTYSLIHDDLPAMDDDTLRRGRPTLHMAHGEGTAILAGDGLLTEAFALLSREPACGEPVLLRRRMQTLSEIARAAGALGMVGGQAIDLAAAGAATPGGDGAAFDLERLREMHAMKTGALIRASAIAGAIMAGGTSAAIAAIADYASALGLAFQIVDDILDVEGATEDLGKTAGKDAAAGKPTYPAIVGLERSRHLAAEAHAESGRALARVGIDGGRLHEIAEWVVGRRN